jgi:hypothetical protein
MIILHQHSYLVNEKNVKILNVIQHQQCSSTWYMMSDFKIKLNIIKNVLHTILEYGT